MNIGFGGKTSVDLIEADDRICIGIAAGKAFEKESRVWWGETLASHMLDEPLSVIDVGAYTGIYGIAAAKLGYHVFAIEPLPQNLERAMKNSVENGVRLGTIEFYQFAASDHGGEGELGYNATVPLTSGGSLIIKKEEYARLPVKLMTLDSFIPESAWITAMKIDVERTEAAVLKGARKILDRCQPLLMIEVLDLERLLEVEEAIPDYRRARRLDRMNFLYEPRSTPVGKF